MKMPANPTWTSGGEPAAYEAISFSAQVFASPVSRVRAILGNFCRIAGRTESCCQRFSSALTRADQTMVPCASPAAGALPTLPPMLVLPHAASAAATLTLVRTSHLLVTPDTV